MANSQGFLADLTVREKMPISTVLMHYLHPPVKDKKFWKKKCRLYTEDNGKRKIIRVGQSSIVCIRRRNNTESPRLHSRDKGLFLVQWALEKLMNLRQALTSFSSTLFNTSGNICWKSLGPSSGRNRKTSSAIWKQTQRCTMRIPTWREREFLVEQHLLCRWEPLPQIWYLTSDSKETWLSYEHMPGNRQFSHSVKLDEQCTRLK